MAAILRTSAFAGYATSSWGSRAVSLLGLQVGDLVVVNAHVAPTTNVGGTPSWSVTQGGLTLTNVAQVAIVAGTDWGQLCRAYGVVTVAGDKEINLTPWFEAWQSLAAAAFYGIAASPFDQYAGNSGASSTSATSSTTPSLAQANELVVGGVAFDGTTTTITETGGFTLIQEHEGATYNPLSLTYKSVNSTAGVEATWTFGAARQYGGSVMTFKESGGGGGGTILPLVMHHRKQMGVS